MKKRLVVFGGGDMAQLADFYFQHDSDYEVVAFTLDRDYVDGEETLGRPLVPFDEIEDKFSPADHEMFIALSYTKLNALRRAKYEEALAKGYTLATYLSSKATYFPGFEAAPNCFILEDNTIQPFARIEHNVTLWSGNHIGHHSIIRAHTFIASHIVVSGGVDIGEQCFLGVNATLRDHITIGDRCVIGAGALILKDCEPDGLYKGTATERAVRKSSQLRKI